MVVTGGMKVVLASSLTVLTVVTVMDSSTVVVEVAVPTSVTVEVTTVVTVAVDWMGVQVASAAGTGVITTVTIVMGVGARRAFFKVLGQMVVVDVLVKC